MNDKPEEIADYYLFDLRNKISSEFDEKNHYFNSVVKTDIGILYNQMVWSIFTNEKVNSSQMLEMIALFNKALDYICSSYILLRHGSYTESLTLLRASVENICVGINIGLENSVFNQYMRSDLGCFTATKSVSYANKHIKFIGVIWSAFSKIAVHPNKQVHGSKPKNGRDFVEIGGRETSEYQDEVTLISISLVTSLLLRAIEITLFEPIEGDVESLRIPGTNKIRKAVALDLIEDRLSALESIFDEERQQ